MNVSQLAYIDSAGYHFADYPTFLTWLQGQYQGIYGTDTILTPDTQDGQFVAIVAQALYDVASLGSSTFNSFSPVTAQGVGLARVVKINGISKEVATNSTVSLTIVGAAGTVITNGVAQDTLNQLWNLPSSVTIPSGGSITVTATAQVAGSINAAANTITTIFTPTLGWQTVNNSANASPGNPVEEDGTLRARQIQSVANPSLTVLEGTYGAIANVPGVTAVQVWENDTAATDANHQPAHSIFAVVQGGSLSAVAEAIQIHKTPGTYPWPGPFYTFTCSSANATMGATYTNNGAIFTVFTTISSGTVLVCTSTGVPSGSGTLTKSGGTGDSSITFSAVTNTGGSNQTQTVFDSRGMPIVIGFYQPPDVAEIGVQVTLTVGPGWTTDFETTIAAQVAAYINSLGVGAGQQFGGKVRYVPLYSYVYVPNYVPSMYTITSVEIQLNSDGFSTSDRTIPFTSLPSCSASPGTDVVFVL